MNNKSYFGLTIIFAISLIISSVILSDGISSISNSKNIITVTGSARQSITSDFGNLLIVVSTKGASSDAAYSVVEENTKKIINFYKKIAGDSVTIRTNNISVISVDKYTRDGSPTGEVSYYSASQTISISSEQVFLIEKLSVANVKELYNLGIDFSVNSPTYSYSKVQDLKIAIQAKATLDAKERALKIAEASGTKVDKLVNARMGVLQIVPRGSNEISDWGTNDETAIYKDMIAVVSVSFSVKE